MCNDYEVMSTRIKSSFSSALICTAHRRIQTSACTNQEPEKGDLMADGGVAAGVQQASRAGRGGRADAAVRRDGLQHPAPLRHPPG